MCLNTLTLALCVNPWETELCWRKEDAGGRSLEAYLQVLHPLLYLLPVQLTYEQVSSTSSSHFRAACHHAFPSHNRLQALRL